MTLIIMISVVMLSVIMLSVVASMKQQILTEFLFHWQKMVRCHTLQLDSFLSSSLLKKCRISVSRISVIRMSFWRHDIQHDNTEHKGLICDTKHK
jgi:hypothetical protein